MLIVNASASEQKNSQISQPYVVLRWGGIPLRNGMVWYGMGWFYHPDFGTISRYHLVTPTLFGDTISKR